MYSLLLCMSLCTHFVQKQRFNIMKTEILNRKCGSSGTAPALQAQSLEFKP
jgi:hypothetical protein